MAAASGSTSIPPLYNLNSFDYEFDHEFTQLANWLIPGRVLAGRYPYIEPSRCSDRAEGELQLRQLLQAGVKTFVCLQEELPPQRFMRIGGERGFLPYLPVATMLAASMQAPPDVGITSGIRNEHLDQFLPQRKQSSQEASTSGQRPAANSSSSLEFLHCPIPDLGVPTLDQVTGLMTDLTARLERGEILYLHCWGGRGRAGMIGACLLASLYGLHGDEALRRVQKAFNTRGDDVGRCSPETMEQREFVRKFIAQMRKQD